MGAGKVIFGIVLGVAIAGTLIGILFAPDKGSVTRHKLVTEGEDLLGGIKTTFSGLYDSITDKFIPMKDGAKERFYRGKERYN